MGVKLGLSYPRKTVKVFENRVLRKTLDPRREK
jgi:hypothetical protein